MNFTLKRSLVYVIACQTILCIVMIYRLTQNNSTDSKILYPSHKPRAETLDVVFLENQNEYKIRTTYTQTEVRNCITGEIIREKPDRNISVVNFTSHFSDHSVENSESRLKSFVTIFQERIWMGHMNNSRYSGLQASGLGSSLYFAQEIIATLHNVVNWLKKEFNLNRVHLLDVACGDMQWMARFLQSRKDVTYTGVDIVPELIDHNKKTYYKFNWIFKTLDIVNGGINGSYDIILCRMMLQHLKHGDALKVLQHISSSGKYLIATTFPRTTENHELELDKVDKGRVRHLNLELPPYSLEPPLCLHRDGPRNEIHHFVGLWRLPLHQHYKCLPNNVQLFDPNMKTYTC